MTVLIFFVFPLLAVSLLKYLMVFAQNLTAPSNVTKSIMQLLASANQRALLNAKVSPILVLVRSFLLPGQSRLPTTLPQLRSPLHINSSVHLEKQLQMLYNCTYKT